MRPEGVCEVCPTPLRPATRGRPSRYCSSACRQRAFRRRGARDRAVPAPGRAPAPALDSFVGRRKELAALRGLLRSSRLVTLTGPGGIGKTRLALEHITRPRALEGRFVELDGVQDSAGLPHAVATALGVAERGGRTGVDVLADAVESGPLLLVLDNCEHLAGAAALLTAELLRRCARLRILATSREVLRVPGEVVLRVGELPTGGADGGGPSDSVRLFVARAAESDPGFTATPEVGEICRRLDGMPLAIELAARRAGALTPAEILAGLDDRLTLLSDGSRTGPDRHRELSAAIDWSHRLLTEEERLFFRRLAVLAGGFDADAAAAVTGVDPARVLRTLCALESKSLLVRVAGGGDRTRFRQLAAIRAHAVARLADSGEREDTWHRATHWLSGLVAPAGEQVFPDFGGGPREEHENLAAAVAHTAARGRPDRALTIALARIRFQQGQPSAALTLLSGEGPRAGRPPAAGERGPGSWERPRAGRPATAEERVAGPWGRLGPGIPAPGSPGARTPGHGLTVRVDRMAGDSVTRPVDRTPGHGMTRPVDRTPGHGMTRPVDRTPGNSVTRPVDRMTGDGMAGDSAALALAARAACQRDDAREALAYAERAVAAADAVVRAYWPVRAHTTVRETPSPFSPAGPRHGRADRLGTAPGPDRGGARRPATAPGPQGAPPAPPGALARLANALDARAAAHLCGGRFEDAVEDFRACRRVVTALGRPEDEAWCTHHLAWALLHTGRAEEADALMAACLPVLDERPVPACQAAAGLHTAGAVRLALGDARGAGALFARSLRYVAQESFHSLYPLEGLAIVAAERGAVRRALLLFTAAAESWARLRTEPERSWRRQVEETARRAAGTLPAGARAEALAAGRGLRWPQVLSYALDTTATAPGAVRRTDGGTPLPGTLTARESAVAALVAEGLTNRQIAARLGLSPSTVATHLDRVRDKLGVRSRTQIALRVAHGPS
ncbi:LuxR C-terminal-related transcriptional regulator [Streptomyces sp. NPDC057638]|uniref:helix-turn-helix transcriptional regulator n=1 Tax=Streptomyces sp. NPDC057638 TaxID=3346190 RepID=UPI00367C3E2C